MRAAELSILISPEAAERRMSLYRKESDTTLSMSTMILSAFSAFLGQ